MEYRFYELQNYVAKMAASTSSAFGPNGPFHFQTLLKFDGKKALFHDINLKLKAYLSLVSTAFKKAMDRIDDNLEQQVFGEHFSREYGHLRWGLVEVAMSPSHDVCGASFHICSSRDYDEWVLELEAVVARSKLPSETRAVGRLSKILKPRFCGNMLANSGMIFLSARSVRLFLFRRM